MMCHVLMGFCQSHFILHQAKKDETQGSTPAISHPVQPTDTLSSSLTEQGKSQSASARNTGKRRVSSSSRSAQKQAHTGLQKNQQQKNEKQEEQQHMKRGQQQHETQQQELKRQGSSVRPTVASQSGALRKMPQISQKCRDFIKSKLDKYGLGECYDCIE